MDIRYKIKFYSDWHCGSGLSSGADLDLLVVKDKYKLPFIPGKTMKGLIKEALEEIKEFKRDQIDLVPLLGKEANAANDANDKDIQGACFFKNAELEKTLKDKIIDNGLQEYLYKDISSTAINKEGVADEHSLRRMEVTIPCELEGEILAVPDEHEKLFSDALKFIKRLGQNRNRGLGRCSIYIIPPGKKEGETL